MINNYDLIIIGAGAAGLGAAVYAGRYRLRVLVIGEKFGGETAQAGYIENYPGIGKIDGYDLMVNMRDQAKEMGVELVDKKVDRVERRGHCFEVVAGEDIYQANQIILAMGTKRRRLNLPNETELTGHGVHYCVTCDGPFYKDKVIAMVGGGDASIKGINLASEYVKKVYLIVLEKEVRAEPVNWERMKVLGDKVEILYETQVKEIVGEARLEKIIIDKEYQGSNELAVDGLFVEIGAVRNVALAEQLSVNLDEKGYVMVDNMMKTNVDGVYACGDTVNHFGDFKQIITAVAMGAVAATSAYEDNKIHGDLCPYHFVPKQFENK
ncbi:MAG: FAD-dependent oxidoreductase [Patescibacteria group bacterium]